MYSVVQSCEVCARVNAVLTIPQNILQPLPVMPLFWRWSVDLCSFTETRVLKNRRVLLCVEHYSRFAILDPLGDKKAITVAQAFRDRVLGVFGAPAELVSDNGSEFDAEFTKLCEENFIDRRWTSTRHPQSNGATERIVRTLKNTLRRMATVRSVRQDWDQHLYRVAQAYNCSVQSSTHMCPYTIVFAKEPGIPTAAKPHFDATLSVLEVEGTQ